MKIEQKLPVSYLLFTNRGRIDRLTFWTAQIFIWSSFYILIQAIESLLGFKATYIIYPLLFWSLYCTSRKRLQDSNKTGKRLLLIAVPVLGPLLLVFWLGFKKGTDTNNSFGSKPGSTDNYLSNQDAQRIPHLKSDERIINDVTQLNPVLVAKVESPRSIEQLQKIVAQSDDPVSIGGGRFSMGGQTASPQSLHIDMRQLNKVVSFSKENKTIKVEAGIRWCDIQEHIDKYDLSVKIMQTYANFTVGGSLSVNVHGRYIGQGPLILSVIAIQILLANGDLVEATADSNKEIFYTAIGGFGGIGIITTVELMLADNIAVKRKNKLMGLDDYGSYFKDKVRHNNSSIFHNGDIYISDYKKINAVTWTRTSEKPTNKTRLMSLKDSYPIERYFFWAFSETFSGQWVREKIIEPVYYLSKRVHWRNYEAGYDVAELEPKSRKKRTYVLQEYFVPIDQFDDFNIKMAEIFQRHKVNVVNISVRHAKADSGSYLAWAKEEVFAYVIYYKQRTRDNAKTRVAVWTRELIDAVLSVNGSYYLPYQIHATKQQFHKAYPRANEFFQVKQKLDPNNRFRNSLWDSYYQNESDSNREKAKDKELNATSEFLKIYHKTKTRDDFYRFLQVVFHLHPEDRFHDLIIQACQRFDNDKEIYQYLQKDLASIKPILADLTYALPALKTQKKEMTRQTLALLEKQNIVDGYLEIGSPGRYISDLKKHLVIKGDIHLMNDYEPSYSIADVLERGQIKKFGSYINLNYEAITEKQIKSSGLDLVTCYIGIHHCPLEKIDDFIESIHRVLRPGGKLIIRDHDVSTNEMKTFVSLVHTVFNLGTSVSWEENSKEFRNFHSIDYWVEYLQGKGFIDSGHRLLQAHDPSDNTLIILTKELIS